MPNTFSQTELDAMLREAGLGRGQANAGVPQRFEAQGQPPPSTDPIVQGAKKDLAPLGNPVLGAGSKYLPNFGGGGAPPMAQAPLPKPPPPQAPKPPSMPGLTPRQPTASFSPSPKGGPPGLTPEQQQEVDEMLRGAGLGL